MRRRHTIASMLLAGALALAACSGGDDDPTDATDGPEGPAPEEPELQEVTLGVLPIIDVAPAYLGLEQGFFEEEGIDLTIDIMGTGPTGIAAIVNGEMEFGFAAVTSVLLAQSVEIQMRLVAPASSSTGVPGADSGGIVAGADSGIETVSDLAGRSVAVNTLGNIAEATLRVPLEDAGVDPSSVSYVEMPFADTPQALSLGHVDAAWLVEPFLTIAIDNGAALVTSNMIDAGGADNLLIAVYFASEELVESSPELVASFQRAIQRSMDYAEGNPDEARRIIQTYTEMDANLARAISLPAYRSDALTTAAIQHVVDLSAAEGIVPADLDVESLMP